MQAPLFRPILAIQQNKIFCVSIRELWSIYRDTNYRVQVLKLIFRSSARNFQERLTIWPIAVIIVGDIRLFDL